MLVRSATLSPTSFATSEIADGIADAQSWGPRSVSRPLIMFVNGPADA